MGTVARINNVQDPDPASHRVFINVAGKIQSEYKARSPILPHKFTRSAVTEAHPTLNVLHLPNMKFLITDVHHG